MNMRANQTPAQRRASDRRKTIDRREHRASNQRRALMVLGFIIVLELAYIGAHL